MSEDRFFLDNIVIVPKLSKKQYLADANDFIKLNYNCPDDEKTGSGPGSCSNDDRSSNMLDKYATAVSELRSAQLAIENRKLKGIEDIRRANIAHIPHGIEDAQESKKRDLIKLYDNLKTAISNLRSFTGRSDNIDIEGKKFVMSSDKKKYIVNSGKNISVDDKKILRNYTQKENIYMIQRMLRGETDIAEVSKKVGVKLPEGESYESLLSKQSDDISDIIKKYSINEDITTYRGGDTYLIDILERAEPGDIIPIQTFTSTSVEERGARKFSDSEIIEYRIPKYASAMSLESVSKFKSEHEVLLDKNINVKLISYKVINRKGSNEQERRAIVEVIPESDMKVNRSSIDPSETPVKQYLEDVTNFIKSNANCKESEKVGGEHPCSNGQSNDLKQEFIRIKNKKDLITFITTNYPGISEAEYSFLIENNSVSEAKKVLDYYIGREEELKTKKQASENKEKYFNRLKDSLDIIDVSSVDSKNEPINNIWLKAIGGKLPENDPSYYYHSTTIDKMGSIAEHGLVPKKSDPNFSQEINPNTDLNFFSGDISRMEYWSKRIFTDDYSYTDGKFARIPIILRVKREKVSNVKEVGVGYEFRTKSNVSSKSLEMWKNGKWIPIK